MGVHDACEGRPSPTSTASLIYSITSWLMDSTTAAKGSATHAVVLTQLTCIVWQVILCLIVISSWRLSWVITMLSSWPGCKESPGSRAFSPWNVRLIFQMPDVWELSFCPCWQKVKVRYFSQNFCPKAPEHQLCSGARGRNISYDPAIDWLFGEWPCYRSAYCLFVYQLHLLSILDLLRNTQVWKQVFFLDLAELADQGGAGISGA